MKKFLSTKPIILIVILALAAILRFWNLGNVPPSASLDEASIGYNAYSVLKTGGDEYGEFPLLSQRGYDDWRRSTYLFLTVPFVALFGLNVVAVRLPAVILSILTVWATYHITLLLFSKRSTQSLRVALFASFLLAISPWHIYISRLGHESNASLAFLVFGVLFFLQGQKSKGKILLSMIFFTLSMVSYYSGQAFIPLLGIGLLFIFRKTLLSMVITDKRMLIAVIIFVLLLIPLFSQLFSREALIRYQGTNIFAAYEERFYKQAILLKGAIDRGDIVGQIFYNRRILAVQIFMEGYLSHFDPRWLFANLGEDKHKVPNMGLLYLWEIPLIFVGFITLFFSRVVDGKVKKLIFLWFFLAPIPAAIATQAPHAMRSYSFLPMWQIFSAFGLVYIFYKFPRLQKFNGLISLFSIVLILVSMVNFYKNYFIVFPQTQSSSFQYALAKTIPYVLSQQKNYHRIVFSNRDNLYQSYMLFLFHGHYDPSLYQKLGGTKSGGYAQSHVFDKYEFKSIDLKKESMEEGVLYVVNVSEISDSQSQLKTFNNLDGKAAIVIITKKVYEN